MIFKETIEEVKERLDIVDVISDFVSLKKAGQNYKALSPFTNEKTPSFFVVPAKGIFKDFSSGKGGDAFTFVMEHEGMSYAEAIRYLAKKYGVEIKESVQTEEDTSDRESLLILMNFAKDYFKELLLKDEEGRGVGLSYFRERGFNDRTIQKFELGYALKEWEGLSKEAKKKGYNEELLDKAGLVVKKEDGSSYDRFRGRVIFPVHNISGKVVAFGARMLGKEKNQPKYINSPETEIYHKSNVLYGLYQAKNAIRQHDNCYLVEGYTDVISLHQSEVENVVASSGTALTEEQIRIIRRFTDNVTVLFDGDAAGIKAALRGIDLILQGDLNVKVVLFPDGEDPDSHSRKVGSTKFKSFLTENSKDFILFKIDLYKRDSLNDPIRKAEVIRDIIESISKIPNNVKRLIYAEECSKQLNVPLTLINSELNKILIQARISRRKELQRDELNSTLSFGDIHNVSQAILYDPSKIIKILEREFLKVLILFGNHEIDGGHFVYDFLIRETEDINFLDSKNQEIIDLYMSDVVIGKVPKADEFVNSLSSDLKTHIADFFVTPYKSSPGWSNWKGVFLFDGKEYIIEKAIKDSVIRLKLRVIESMLMENMTRIKKAKNIEEEKNTLETQQMIEMAKIEIASVLGTVILQPAKHVEGY